MAGYLYTDNIRTKNTRSFDGTGHANTPTVGLYGTWLNSDGWFVDATLRAFWSDMKLTGYTAQGGMISFDADRYFTAGSLEAGRQLSWDITDYSKWVMEPKLELSYAYAKAKSFNAKGATNSKIR